MATILIEKRPKPFRQAMRAALAGSGDAPRLAYSLIPSSSTSKTRIAFAEIFGGEPRTP